MASSGTDAANHPRGVRNVLVGTDVAGARWEEALLLWPYQHEAGSI